MEHAQRIRQEFVNDRRYYVLILILIEHAQIENRKVMAMKKIEELS